MVSYAVCPLGTSPLELSVMERSDEVRHPLTAIQGYAQLMQRRQLGDPQALEGIVAASHRLERLLADLLEGGLEASQFVLRPTEVDLVALTRASAEQAQRLTRRHSVRLELSSIPPLGWWDGDRVGQVLDNLLTNAIKYSAGGEIVCRVGHDAREAWVSVTDEGPGIPPSAVPRLFERSYRGEDAAASHPQGQGLGLYLSKTFVQLHGGRIWVDSQPGLGSTFTFALPYEDIHRRVARDEQYAGGRMEVSTGGH